MLSTLACYVEDNTAWHAEDDKKFTPRDDEIDSLYFCRKQCKQIGAEYFTWKGPKDGSGDGPCWCNNGIKERRNWNGYYSGKTVMEGKCLSEIPCKFYTFSNYQRVNLDNKKYLKYENFHLR